MEVELISDSLLLRPFRDDDVSRLYEAVRESIADLMARFAFEQIGLHRVEILAAIPNVASQRVAEKTGAVREGVLRNRLLIGGVSQDAVLFSLIPRDL